MLAIDAAHDSRVAAIVVGWCYVIDRHGPLTGDAIGRMLAACHEAGGVRGAVVECFERSDGYISTGDPARYFAPPHVWSDAERWVLQHAGGRVLDIGAGAGRHSLYLASLGYDVTALDVSPGAVDVCRARGVANAVTGTVFDLERRQRFETFVLLGNNLGLLQSAEHARRMLARLREHAAPGAVILGQSFDPLRDIDELTRRYHADNRARGRLPGQSRFRVRFEELATDWDDFLFVSRQALMVLVAGTGWALTDHRDDGNRYCAVLSLVS